MSTAPRRLLPVIRGVRAIAFGVGLALLVAIVGSQAFATHVRYLHLTWDSDGGNVVEFTYISVFRRDGYSGTGNDGHPVVGDVITENIGGTTLCFGDGACTSTLQFEVTDYDVDDNFIIARAYDEDTGMARISHEYDDEGPYVAFSQSCCRISGSDFQGINRHWNNPNGSYRIETLVNPGQADRSIRSDLAPIETCPVDGECSVSVPALGTGQTGTTLRYRMAEPDEAGGFGFNQPDGADIDADTGEFLWDTTGADFDEDFQNNLYSAQVIVEELDADEEVVAKVGVDFFLRLSDADGNPPAFQTPEEAEEPVNTAPGRPIQFFVSVEGGQNASALQPQDAHEITLNVQSLPDGAFMDPPLPITGEPPVGSEFNWTPSSAQLGSELVTFRARSSDGQVSRLTYTLDVVSRLLDVTAGANAPAEEIQADAGDTGVVVMQFDLSAYIEAQDEIVVDSLTLEGSNLANVAAVNLYLDASGDGSPEGDALASATSLDLEQGLVVLDLTEPLTFDAGDSQTLVVTYDFAPDIAGGLPTQTWALLALLPLGLLGIAAARRRRTAGMLAAGVLTMSIVVACGAPAAPAGIEHHVSLTEVSAQAQEQVVVEGLPYQGSTVTVRR